jgi:hypothetical protein
MGRSQLHSRMKRPFAARSKLLESNSLRTVRAKASAFGTQRRPKNESKQERARGWAKRPPADELKPQV